MSLLSIPDTAQSLLLYLLNAKFAAATTLDAMRRAELGFTNLEEILSMLIEIDFVCKEGDAYELSFAGVQFARRIEAQVLEDQIGTDDSGTPHASAELAHSMPLFDTHPLRTSLLHPYEGIAPRRAELHFMLAFEVPRNVLPTPVLDGDTLGRSTEVDICLDCDEFISGRHCRFHIDPMPDGVWLSIEDLGSRNGTLVDGVPLEPNMIVPLRHGSRIRVGSTILIVMQIPY